MEYTKEEWGITSVAPTIPNVLTIYSNGKRIALVMPDENQKANARLIAAAPDLYEAMIIIVNHFRMLDKLYSKDLEILNMGSRAIAKAEGGNNGNSNAPVG